MLNDQLVRERHASNHGGRQFAVACGNALPLFTGIKVFTKLGVESRGQLARALPQRSADRLG
jgi:hypothetical protein